MRWASCSSSSTSRRAPGRCACSRRSRGSGSASAKGLSINGEVLVALGAIGEVIKVIRDDANGVSYHVHFDSLSGRVLQIPEDALEALEAKE